MDRGDISIAQLRQFRMFIQESPEAFFTAGNLQIVAIGRHIPTERKTSFGKSLIESNSVGIPFGIGEGPVHIKDQRTQWHESLSPEFMVKSVITTG